MAARRKGKATRAKKSTRTKRGASRKKVSRKKKATARKKAARKKVARKKKAARKKAAKRATGRKAPPKKGARKGAAKKPAKKAAGSAIEAVARRIVKFTKEGSTDLAALYADDATSVEPGGGEPLVGLAALQGKLDMWESMQTGTVWNPRNVWTRGNTIAIEWDCDVTLANGRKVKLEELAVHEIRGGKIAAERYYYDPSVLSAAAGAAANPDPAESRRPEPPREPLVERASGAIDPQPVEPDPDRAGEPPIDPLDL